MKKQIHSVLCAGLASVLILFSFASAGENGGYAGSFLRMGLGAPSLAQGNATIAGTPNAYSFYYNPASVAFLDGKVASLSYSFLTLDRRFNYIGFAMPIKPAAGFSLGWINSGNADFPGYNSLGEEYGQISHSLNAVYFSFARKFGKRVSVGLSVKYMWERINDGGVSFDYSSTGVGWDVGIYYRPLDNLTLAVMVQDAGSKFKASTTEIFERGGTTTDYFPALYRAGLRYETFWKWLVINYTFEASSKLQYKHFIGLESRYIIGEKKDGDKFLALRAGMSNGTFTAGAGMGFQLFKIISHLDYAFVSSVVDEGSSHIFSWQFYLN
ncbi:MAG TPA: hypothetical protein ENK44_01905 [Caldithrix abyssi]|uniref:PorV/PorQ family protein n=1 Tax=Caldithrix abyssi TaxID=187145 RepID=A0A7V4TY27_CALAY|nr:hypothetical protein [Caldithrix abyssi]